VSDPIPSASPTVVLSSALVPRSYPSADNEEPLVEFMIDPARARVCRRPPGGSGRVTEVIMNALAAVEAPAPVG
jgi:hypothetical protein